MRKYDILDIAIKVLGLSMVPTIFYYLIVSFYSLFEYANGEGIDGYIGLVAITLLGYVMYFVVVYLFIFKTKFILNLIAKRADLEVEINIKAKRSGLLNLTFIVIGAISLIKTVPSLLFSIYQFNQANKLNDQMDRPFVLDAENLISDIFVIVFGSILIIYAKPLGDFLAKRTDEIVDPFDTDI